MASNTRVNLRATASVFGGHEIESSSGDAGYHRASLWYFFFFFFKVLSVVPL